jgi:hypothetical protein
VAAIAGINIETPESHRTVAPVVAIEAARCNLFLVILLIF